ncbi:oligosaccharide flippase family protein [Granulicella cerasi]|uniref:Oligosaccharide flippase family protein n=1 Tax=Granulicella cerasi TaxID=741063 RepID=A0ABW1ZA79_9BACT|nr:oligosaccharide flippase family protein [Granulicella cerasi]
MEQTQTPEETLEAAQLVSTPAIDEAGQRAGSVAALEKRAVSATVWTVLDYGLSQSLRVVNSLVLTHLLLPSAIGEMTLVTTLIVGVTLLSDVGLQPSIIQNSRGDDPVFLDTAWTIQVLRGLIMWIGACILAIPAAHFYHDPPLAKILPVLALTTIITGFNSTGLLTLSRHMGVRRLFFVDTSTQVVTLVFTIGWAYASHTVWALVAGAIFSNAFRLVLSHLPMFVPGHRNRFSLDRESLREIFAFGKWIFLGTAFFFFASQADRLLLGRLTTMTVLGVYSVAFQISDVPRSVINAFSSRVGFPFAARLKDLAPEEFRRRYLRYRLYVLLAGAAMLSIMSAWGGYVVSRVYPTRYHDAVWMIPILAIGLWHTLLYNTSAPALMARGISAYNASGNAAYAAAMLVGIPIGYTMYGLPGAIVAIAAGDFPLYVVTQFGAVKHGIKPLRQDFLLTLVFLACLALNFWIHKLVLGAYY